jgi:hypothetical protein
MHSHTPPPSAIDVEARVNALDEPGAYLPAEHCLLRLETLVEVGDVCVRVRACASRPLATDTRARLGRHAHRRFEASQGS